MVLGLGQAEIALADNRELNQEVLAQVKKRFTEAKSDHWKSWLFEDMKADLKTFYNKTGVYLSWSLFEDKFESVPQRTDSYAIGVKEGKECWYISNVTDRSATSNVGVPPFTMSMEIDAKTDGKMILY